MDASIVRSMCPFGRVANNITGVGRPCIRDTCDDWAQIAAIRKERR